MPNNFYSYSACFLIKENMSKYGTKYLTTNAVVSKKFQITDSYYINFDAAICKIMTLLLLV